MVWQWQRHMGYLNFEKLRSRCSEIRHYMCVRYQNKVSHKSSPHMGCFNLVGLMPTHMIPYFCGYCSANQPRLIGRIAKCLARIWRCILCAFATLSFFVFFFLAFSLNTHTYGVGSIMCTHTHIHTPILF